MLHKAVTFACICLAWALLVQTAAGADQGWRLHIKEAAVTSGPAVLLGEIAEPVGPMTEREWKKLAATPLWPAPKAERQPRPMVMTKAKLARALDYYLPEIAPLCMLPGSLVIQRGGAALTEQDLINQIVKALTPRINALPGEASMREFKVPSQIFLSDSVNVVAVEPVGDIKPGRLGLRLIEVSLAGEELRRYSASVFVDEWIQVPAAGRPLNRGDALDLGHVTHVRKNRAYLRGAVWDGRGGPWRIKRPIGLNQVIYMSDLEPLPLIRRGDAVSLMFQSANFRLETSAVALEDGGYGESIEVRNTSSKKTITARVKDAGAVVVQ